MLKSLLLAIRLLTHDALSRSLALTLTPCLRPTPPAVPRRVQARSHAAKHPTSLSAVSMSAAVSGQHGTESHFLPIDQLDGDQTAPRILPIAGVFPGITAAEVR